MGGGECEKYSSRTFEHTHDGRTKTYQTISRTVSSGRDGSNHKDTLDTGHQTSKGSIERLYINTNEQSQTTHTAQSPMHQPHPPDCQSHRQFAGWTIKFRVQPAQCKCLFPSRRRDRIRCLAWLALVQKQCEVGRRRSNYIPSSTGQRTVS